MLAIILCLFRFVRLLGSGHQAVAVENLALRLQLAAFKKKPKRPVLTQWDRLFWVGLSRVWSSWRDALVFVQPDTSCAGKGSVPKILGPAVPIQPGWARKARRRPRDSPVDPTNGYSQSTLEGAENPWRTEDARYYDFGANRVTTPSDRSATTTIPKLENVPS
jgi:hypothetical protein